MRVGMEWERNEDSLIKTNKVISSIYLVEKIEKNNPPFPMSSRY